MPECDEAAESKLIRVHSTSKSGLHRLANFDQLSTKKVFYAPINFALSFTICGST